MKINSYLLLILLFSFACETDDTPIVEGGDDEFQIYLEDERQDQEIPALSALVFKENRVLLNMQMGVADLEQDKRLAQTDLFLLASVSKVITATALLQLFDAGEIELDAPINDYLPFTVQVPGYEKAITVRMLLTHTSGIADSDALDSQYYYGEDSPTALKTFMEAYLVEGKQYYNASDNFHDFEPGTKNEYSNVGNALIGVLVEEVSGIGFNRYCKENIFEPLGMNNTFWSLEEALGSTNGMVRPYDEQREPIDHYTFTDYPNGGLRSTAEDLTLFLQELMKAGTDGSRLVSKSTYTEMITLQVPTLSNSMGLHLFLLNAPNNLWGHDGGEAGVSTIMAFNPDDRIGVVLLANTGDADLDEMVVRAYEYAADK